MPVPLIPAMSATRVGIGALSLLTPTLTARVFGITGPTSPLVGRLFGAREVALGMALQDPDPRARRRALQAGIAIDALDALATVVEFKRGRIGLPGLLLIGTAATSFIGMGLAALAEEPAEA